MQRRKPYTTRRRARTDAAAAQASKTIIENYYSRLTMDFATNKRVADEVAVIPTKRLRNKIAGFTTHMMKRIHRGPVRGISLKLQEEERERRLDYVPDQARPRASPLLAAAHACVAPVRHQHGGHRG